MHVDAMDDRLERLHERLDPFMAWLGVVFALVVGYEIAVELTPRSAAVLQAVGWAIWAIFLVEFLLGLWLAPQRWGYVRRRWFSVLALLLPTLRLLRFLRLLRVGRALPAARVASASYRSIGTAKRVARSRLGYIAAISSVVVIAIAEAAYLFERDRENGIFTSFGDAVLWSAATVFGQQADPVPGSVGARLAMIVGFVLGTAVVATVAATLGAWFVDERRERATVETTAP